MEEVGKKVLCYYILSYVCSLTGFDITKLTNEDVIKELEKLENYSYDVLLSTYEYLNTMFIDKFGIKEE